MGPLDGRWRVSGPGGEALFEVLLMDRGDGRLVEGAWRALSAPAAGLASRRLGAFTLVARDGPALVLSAAEAAEPIELRLEPDGAGWRGVLGRDGASTPVTMARAD